MGCGDVRLLKTIGGIEFTRQERVALNKLTMPCSTVVLLSLHVVHPLERVASIS